MRSRTTATSLKLTKRSHRDHISEANKLMLALSAAFAVCSTPVSANRLTVQSGATDLTAAATYGGVTPTNATDVLFSIAYPTSPTIFTIGSASSTASQNVTMGSLNVANNYAISIGNNTSMAAINNLLTLGSVGNTDVYAGSNSGSTGDLIYLNGLTSNLTIQGSNLNSSQSSGTGTLNIVLGRSGNFEVAQTGATLTISSAISDSGSGYSITKTGAGTLTLSGADTYSGGTTVSGGTLNVNAANALGIGGLAVNNANTGTASSIIVNFNASQTVASLSSTVATASSGNNTAQVSIASGATLNDAQSGMTSYGGSISGYGSLSIGVGITGGNALVNYTGTDSASQTNVGANATLQLNNVNGPALSSPVAIATGGTVTLATSQQVATATPPTNTPTAAAVTLNGGTLNANGHSDGTISGTLSTTNPTATAVTSSMGALALGAAGTKANPSILDFGATQTGGGPFVLAFADSNSSLSTGYLNILNYNYTGGVDALYIGSAGHLLTTSELQQIAINGVYGVRQFSNGEIGPAAAPEPSGVVALLLGAGAVGGRIAARRRQAVGKAA